MRDDDFRHTLRIGTSALPPEADRRASNAKVEVAVDHGYDETGRAYDLRRRRLAADRRHLRAAKLALRVRGSTAGSGQPDEQQCDP
jgi:hypothetical protein